MSAEALEKTLLEAVEASFKRKESELNTVQPDLFNKVLRQTALQAIDNYWQRHLTGLDMLREGIGLASLGRDPLVEYQRESFAMFNEMQDQIAELAVNRIFRVQAVLNAPARKLQLGRPVAAASGGATAPAKPQPVKKSSNIGRNDPCHCGSGKKYKDCHYIIERQQQKA
jgi:preprotein translocase subunit SecA